MAEKPEIWRPFYLRFRLRSLLLLIVAVALLAGWVSERARRQRDAAAMVRAEGIVWYEKPSEQLIAGLIQAWTAKLLGDDFAYRVVKVRIDADKTDDFTALDGLPYIESADLGGRTLDGAALADILSRTPKLQDLWIWNVGRLTTTDLLCVRRLPLLKYVALDFRSEKEAEELLGKVSQLDHPRSLYVNCPRLTATMVRHLAKATGLEKIGIGAQCKSPAEIRRLRDALPRCKIVEYDSY